MAQSFKLAVTNVRHGNRPGSKRLPHNAKRRLNLDLPVALPPQGAIRWRARDKASVVNAIRTGLITLDDACERYALSVTEYRTWEAGFDALGLEGLGLAGRQLRRRALAYHDK